MVDYRMKFQPLYEAVMFIELYVNHHHEYKNLEKYCENDQEREGVKELRRLCVEVGEQFQKHFAEHSFLFTYINAEKGVSPIKSLLFGSCDYTMEDPHVQIEGMRAYYQQDSKRFLYEVITAEKELAIDKDCTFDQFIEQFDELLLSDELKWKLWRLQFQLPCIFDTLDQVVDEIQPILLAHQQLYDTFLSMYQKEIDDHGALGGFYEQLMQLVGYFNQTENVLMIPTLAGCKSISFNDQENGMEIVIYGIGTYRRMAMDTAMSDEELCSNLKLLSDKSKFDILRFISKERAYGAQIANELKLSTPTISYHMQALLCAQLVTFEKENNKLYYKVNEDYLRSFLQQVQERLLKVS